MSFDGDVDHARKKLASELDPSAVFDDLKALEGLLPKLIAEFKSKRLEFSLSPDEDETAIEVAHAETEESLGIICFDEDGEFAFESMHADYFDEFSDGDGDRFIKRLYLMLIDDLSKYEMDQEE